MGATWGNPDQPSRRKGLVQEPAAGRADCKHTVSGHAWAWFCMIHAQSQMSEFLEVPWEISSELAGASPELGSKQTCTQG